MTPPYWDLHELEEDNRIDLIGHRVMVHKEIVTFLTDADPGKADRYINKLQTKFPGIRLLDRGDWTVKNVVFIKVGPPVN